MELFIFEYNFPEAYSLCCFSDFRFHDKRRKRKQPLWRPTALSACPLDNYDAQEQHFDIIERMLREMQLAIDGLRIGGNKNNYCNTLEIVWLFASWWTNNN
jgi:hypothetical protein